MFDRYGMAVVQERRHDRRLVALENYLRMEYGSTGGMNRYIAQGNHGSFPLSGLRAFLAGIAGMVSRSSTRGMREPAPKFERTVDAMEEIRWQV
ncbi:MAG: hypothetical protein V3U17_00875 [Thermoplasmata archaeon]